MNKNETLALLEAIAPVVSPQDPALRRARAEVEQEIGVVRLPHVERSGVRRPPVWLRWGAAASVAAGATLALVLMPGSSPGAFASWVPVPVAATAAQTSAAQSECDAAVAGAAPDIAAAEQSSGVDLPDAVMSVGELAGRSVRLAEQRGRVTFVVSSSSSWMVGCLSAPSVDRGLTEATTVDLTRRPAPPSPDRVDVLGSAGESDKKGTSANLVWGRAGSAVRAVHLRTAEGTDLSASVSSGYWSAWWPVEHGGDSSATTVSATAVTVTLADGSTRAAGTVDDLTTSPGPRHTR